MACEWAAGGSAPAAECGHTERPLARLDCFPGPPCRPAWPGLDTVPQPEIVISPLRDGRETEPCQVGCTNSQTSKPKYRTVDRSVQDTSKFCGLIRTHKMCQAKRYREKCCHTCNNL